MLCSLCPTDFPTALALAAHVGSVHRPETMPQMITTEQVEPHEEVDEMPQGQPQRCPYCKRVGDHTETCPRVKRGACSCGGIRRHKPGCEKHVGSGAHGKKRPPLPKKRRPVTKASRHLPPRSLEPLPDMATAARSAAREAVKRKLGEELEWARAYLAELEGLLKENAS